MCTKGKCRYCNSDATLSGSGDSKKIECPVCGNVMYNDFGIYSGGDMLDEIAAYLYYNNNPKMTGKSGTSFTRIYNAEEETLRDYGTEAHEVNLEEVKAFMPQTFAERVDKILLGFAKRSSYFVIAELTEHNNGAYFEAGYALGKEKEVIQICKEDAFAQDGHFDVKQINTIFWQDTDDLKEKLKARTRATIE